VVLAALKKHGPLDARALGDHVTLAPEGVKATLNCLFRDGLLLRTEGKLRYKKGGPPPFVYAIAPAASEAPQGATGEPAPVETACP